LDIREAVLNRLTEIAQDLPGIATAGRNIANVDDILTPAIQILDADETASDNDPSARPSISSRRVGMNPEIYIVLGGKPEDVGPELNAFRAAFLKAVMTDAQLLALLGTNGSIRYEGCATSLSRGRNMEGEMGVSLTFTYILRPQDL
jgi:hypothetical protein